ncbi:Pr6Pr family membrane protein [Nakamurella deserti]|uniref:Pr6Pr family membrane protein n=1 Tax=Nakamurella deserti TaxID=2164074 RepID=UPI000DBE6F86|nr:Pr6Pr family membrane protein [Nakamurella deserti]
MDTDSTTTTGTVVSAGRWSPPALAVVTGWRIVLAGAAWAGFVLGMTRGDVWRWPNLAYWSQFSTLLVALTATGSLVAPLVVRGRSEWPRGSLRGAATTYTTLTLVVFPLLLSGTYDDLDGQLMHLVVPVLAILDWVLVGRNQAGVRWFGPLLWLIVPLLYLPVYVVRSNASRPLYGFLDPARGDFTGWVLILLAAVLLIGHLYWAVGRARAALVPAARPVRG